MDKPYTISGKFNSTNSVDEIFNKALNWLMKHSPESKDAWLKKVNYVIESSEKNKHITFKIRNLGRARLGHSRHSATIHFTQNTIKSEMTVTIPKPIGGPFGYPDYLHEYMFDIVEGIFETVTPENNMQIYPEESLRKIVKKYSLALIPFSLIMSILYFMGLVLIKLDNFWGGFWLEFVTVPFWIYGILLAYKSIKKYGNLLNELYT